MFHKTKRDRYRERQLAAAQKCIEATAARFDIEFDIQPLQARALEAMAVQWGAQEHWDWPAICAEHRTPSSWCFSIWSGDRLCALAAAKMDGGKLRFSYVEGDPRPNCPLRPNRFAIALDALVRYAHLCEANEIWIEPANAALAKRYELGYNFLPVEGSNELRLVLR